MDETGWSLIHFYRLVRFMNQLIEKACAATAEMQALTSLEKEAKPNCPLVFFQG